MLVIHSTAETLGPGRRRTVDYGVKRLRGRALHGWRRRTRDSQQNYRHGAYSVQVRATRTHYPYFPPSLPAATTTSCFAASTRRTHPSVTCCPSPFIHTLPLAFQPQLLTSALLQGLPCPCSSARPPALDAAAAFDSTLLLAATSALGAFPRPIT